MPEIPSSNPDELKTPQPELDGLSLGQEKTEELAAVENQPIDIGATSEKKPELEDEDYKYSPEAVREEKGVKAEKIRSWAKELGLVEGKDFIIQENITDVEVDPEKIAPHENREMAVGVKDELYKKLKDYLEGQYSDERKKENPNNKYGGPNLNYSWGGRFAVINDGVTVNTVAFNEDMSVSTHHQEFREFFRQKNGFDFPTSETLNPLLKEMSEKGLSAYQDALQKLREMADQKTLPGDGYGLIEAMKHAEMILEDAKNGEALVDLPEVLKGTMPAEMRHYADLTYNAEDLKNFDRVVEITGIVIPEESRIDRIFERLNFDRKNIEGICKDFSDYTMTKKELGKISDS